MPFLAPGVWLWLLEGSMATGSSLTWQGSRTDGCGWAGTLYSALDRLRIDGLVEVDREEMVEGRLRRYYRLTPAGTKQLATEAKRVQANAATAFARLGLTRGVTG